MNQMCKLPSVVYLDWIQAQVRELETDCYFLTGNRKKIFKKEIFGLELNGFVGLDLDLCK